MRKIWQFDNFWEFLHFVLLSLLVAHKLRHLCQKNSTLVLQQFRDFNEFSRMRKVNWIFCYPTGKAVGEGSLKFSHIALQPGGHSFYSARSNLAALPLLLMFFLFCWVLQILGNYENQKQTFRHFHFLQQVLCCFFLELLTLFLFYFLKESVLPGWNQ